MLLLLISCFSLMFVLKSLLLRPNKLVNMRVFSPFYWVELSKSIVCFMQKEGFMFGVVQTTILRPMTKVPNVNEYVHVEFEGLTLLGLPDLALDLILDRLSPGELCIMARVCSELRAKCRSNHLWEKHMKSKWGRVIGNIALVQWHEHMAHNMRKYYLNCDKNRGSFWSIFGHWPLSLMVRPKLSDRGTELKVCLPPDSIMGWYLAVESGEFWFPAQVYNRENGHDGFMLSCYDAKLCYNSKSDTFLARYNGRQTVEENITWSRIRAPPIDNPPHELHVSDSLDRLKPGDHFEIQWRRNRDFQYGWWYGVVGHLESCTRDGNHCDCSDNDMVILEFNQYSPDSRWRRMTVNRSHREEGNEGDGFYGGIRKIYSEEEIAIWKSLWPTKLLN